MKNSSYVGSELELFSKARNWKNYYKYLIQDYLQGKVLEVGAGIGGTTKVLCQGQQDCWICLEPDPVLANRIKFLITANQLPECCKVRVGTLSDVSKTEIFDTIIYIDVLEHIKDDRNEVKLAINHLKRGGTLIVLAPAHQWLFTPFDRAIGHYRRYNKINLSLAVPKDIECIKLLYIDSVGLIASLGNRFILKSKTPSRQQIEFWDKVMVPLSRRIDPLIQYSFGKSVLGVWRKKV